MTNKAQLNAVTEIILSLGGKRRQHIDLFKLVDELIQAVEVNAWMSIDSAPKDRDILVGWDSDGVEEMTVAYWNTDQCGGGWTDDKVESSYDPNYVREVHPTRWRELPASWKRP